MQIEQRASPLLMVPLFAALALAGGPGGARAGTIDLLSQTYTASGSASAPAGASPGLLGPAGFNGGLIEGPIALNPPADGTLTISVADLGDVGDVFEVLLDGASLGTTSPAAIGGPSLSTGVFTAAVLAGFHQLDVWDFIDTYAGSASPYGGFVDFGYPDTLVSVSVSLTTADVPEPGSLALLAPAALLALSRARARVFR